MNNILEVRELRKSYKAFTLNNVTFDVPRGYIMGFIGPNGAGKTTTIKMILGIINGDPGSGDIKMPGRDGDAGNNANANSPTAGIATKNENIGVVMDLPMYAEDWRIQDVESAIAPFYKHWDRDAFAKYLNRFNLDPKKKVKELSRGMKVKLQIAAALSHEAKLLILDEPTSGLDPVARDEICDILREFVADENKSVLFSTHITTDLDKTADYITFILGGNVVYTGAKDDLLEKYKRITGGLGELSAEQKKSVIGYREHGTGFEGMIETAQIGSLPENVLTEEITLDEIVIYMNKGVNFSE